MAQAKRSNKKKTSSTTKKSSSSSRSQKSVSKNVGFADYIHAFSKSRFFIPVVIILVITVIILLDLLFAFNNYDKFFKILGFELLITIVIGVFVLAINSYDDSGDNNS